MNPHHDIVFKAGTHHFIHHPNIFFFCTIYYVLLLSLKNSVIKNSFMLMYFTCFIFLIIFVVYFI